MRKTKDILCTESILYKCDMSNTGSIVGASNMETAYYAWQVLPIVWHQPAIQFIASAAQLVVLYYTEAVQDVATSHGEVKIQKCFHYCDSEERLYIYITQAIKPKPNTY